MQKTAQKLKWYNNLRDMTNVSGIAAEKFFNPVFQAVMVDLRLKDDHIRSIASGEDVGDGSSGKDHISLKTLLKQSKSNLNRREYMSAVADLGRFHAKLFEMVAMIGTLDSKVNEVHHEFLFKDLDDDRRKHLQEMKARLAVERHAALIKEAGIMDFFYNIGTQRGRALAAWEKRYPKQTQKLKKDTDFLQKESEKLFSLVLSALKEMASARSVRNVDAYMDASKKITDKYQPYDAVFKKYYNENIKGFLDKIELTSPTKPVEDSGKIGDTPITNPSGGPTAPVVPDLILPTPTTSPTPPTPPTAVTTDNTPTSPAPAPQNMVSSSPLNDFKEGEFPSDQLGAKLKEQLTGPPPPRPQLEPPQLRVKEEPKVRIGTHNKFVESLEALAGESPILLASFINKYAKSIQLTDMETSIKLFKIAQNIKG